MDAALLGNDHHQHATAAFGGSRRPFRQCALGLIASSAAFMALIGCMQLVWSQSWLFGTVMKDERSLAPSVAPMVLVVKDVPGGPGAPLAKRVVVGMDTNVNFHRDWNNVTGWKMEMEPYWTPDAVYDFNYVGPWRFGPSHGVQEWFYGEHMHFNVACPDIQWQDFIRAATHETCTSASYGLGRWVRPFAGVPPPPNKPFVRIHDLDFYLLEGNRIKINWCIIDVVNLFEQVGYRILPPAPMPSNGYRAPNAMDGFPAPLSASVNPADTLNSNRIWNMAIQEDYVKNTGGSRWWAENLVWYGPGGVGTAYSKKDYRTHFLDPLHAAFSNISMQLNLSVCEGKYCGAHFYLHARHTGAWLGEPATGKAVRLRCGAHAHFEGGRIVEGWLIIDVPLAFADMGIDLFARARDASMKTKQMQ